MTDLLDGVTLPLALAEDATTGVIAEVALCGHTTQTGQGLVPVWTTLAIHVRHAETGATLATAEVPAALVDAIATATAAAVDKLGCRDG